MDALPQPPGETGETGESDQEEDELSSTNHPAARPPGRRAVGIPTFPTIPRPPPEKFSRRGRADAGR